eukprot:scaffold31458_cov42-Tisochrysis_lutea.AAC.1
MAASYSMVKIQPVNAICPYCCPLHMQELCSPGIHSSTVTGRRIMGAQSNYCFTSQSSLQPALPRSLSQIKAAYILLDATSQQACKPPLPISIKQSRKASHRVQTIAMSTRDSFLSHNLCET